MNSKVVMTAFMLIVASGVVAADPFDSSFESDFFNTDDSFDTNDWFNDNFFADEEESEEDEGSQDESTESDDFFSDDDWFNNDFFSDDETDEQEETNESDSDTGEDQNEQDETDSNDGDTGNNETDETDSGVTEEAYIEEAPEPGDPYFEAQADGWISYVNPRDEYHPERESRVEHPGSAKVCMMLLNEEGEPIAGETIPNTQASMDMSGAEWHSGANPFTVQYPVTENYDRPLDSDQIGVSDDLPQGDGYMDSHCIEIHLLEEDATLEYDQIEITGDHADEVEVVGYYDHLGTWDSDFDPVEDVDPYGATESSNGVASMTPENSHVQVMAVLQLDR